MTDRKKLTKAKPRAKANRKALHPGTAQALTIKKTADYYVWDTKQDGLGVRVFKSGVRTYVCAWNYPNGPSRIFALGRIEDIGLDEARRRCADARRLAKDGLDPLAGDPKRTLAFKALFEQFTKDQRAENFVSADATETFVLNSCKPWHHRPVGTITWPEIKAVLSTKRDTAPQAANRLHRSLARFFKWLVVNQINKTSPMYGQPEPARAISQESREFAWIPSDNPQVSDDAIKAIWAAADALGGDEGRWLKLVMITGKRRTVVEHMKWEEIHPDTWYWNCPPGSRIKRNHPVPLPKLAQRVLGRHGGTGRVFEGLSNAVTVIRRVRKLTGLDDFIFHALRHLSETKCAELGIGEHMRDRLFDHTPGRRRGSGKGYDKHGYRKERTEAMELWAGHIEQVIAGDDKVKVLR